MNTVFPSYRPNQQPFFLHRPLAPLQPAVDVQKILKLLKKDVPVSLTVKQEQIFMAVLEAEFSAFNSNIKEELCEDFGVGYTSEGIVDVVSHRFNLPRLMALQVVARLMGLQVNYLFETFPAGQTHITAGGHEKTNTSRIPRQLGVGGVDYSLWEIEEEKDFAGNIAQGICTYRSSTGKEFRLLAVRSIFQNRYGMPWPYLTLGREPAGAWLLDRVKIDRLDTGVVILPLNLSLALQLRKVAAESAQFIDKKIIISGVIGNSAAVKNTELTPLRGMTVAIIPEQTREGLLGVEDVAALCRKAGAVDVQIYPWQPIHCAFSAESPQTAWAEELLAKAVRPKDVELPSKLFHNICQGAMELHEYKLFLEKIRLLFQRPKRLLLTKPRLCQ